MFEVDVCYALNSVTNYIEKSISTVLELHQNGKKGDILVFLTGEEEVTWACERINDLKIDTLKAFPLYGTMDKEEEITTLKELKEGERKVIFSTNKAETSVTIDGVVYVLDCGYVKQSSWNPITRSESLNVVPISKASARQRAGRAGRTRAGTCYRLYTHKDHENMGAYTVPEILRLDLSSVVMRLVKITKLSAFDIGKENTSFQFLQKPESQSILYAAQKLIDLNILDADGKPNFSTPKYKIIASLPLEPNIARMVVESIHYGCTMDIIVIVSMLSGIYFLFKSYFQQCLRICILSNQKNALEISKLT